jgi:hypothetical protein
MARENAQTKKVPRLEYLTSWKEIAQYMHAGVRTVQRYERHMGLPVRRPTGKSRGAVMATRAEIDAWIAARPIQTTFELTRTSAETTQNYAAGVERNLRAMVKLRGQMLELREEVHSAMELLIKKVWSLHSSMPSSRLQGYEPLIGMGWPSPMENEDAEDEAENQDRPPMMKVTSSAKLRHMPNKRLH